VIAARPNFFRPVLGLSRLFRRLMLEKLAATHKAGRLSFFGEHAQLADTKAFATLLSASRLERFPNDCREMIQWRPRAP
jgi:hypothetical protein